VDEEKLFVRFKLCDDLIEEVMVQAQMPFTVTLRFGVSGKIFIKGCR